MNTIDILMMWSQLPEGLQKDAAHYIEFLQQKAKAKNQLRSERSYQEVIKDLMKNNFQQEIPQKKQVVLGLAKGLVEMSPDFDEPLI